MKKKIPEPGNLLYITYNKTPNFYISFILTSINDAKWYTVYNVAYNGIGDEFVVESLMLDVTKHGYAGLKLWWEEPA